MSLPDLFMPKGPFPFYLHDFEDKTADLSEAEQFFYLRLCFHLWRTGGFIRDDDNEIAKAMRLQKSRGWRDKITKIRRFLKVATDEEMAKITVRIAGETPYLSTFFCVSQAGLTGFLFQKRVLKDLAQAKDKSQKASISGSQGGRPKKANAFPKKKRTKSSPTPTPLKKEENSPKNFLFNSSREKLAAILDKAPNDCTRFLENLVEAAHGDHQVVVEAIAELETHPDINNPVGWLKTVIEDRISKKTEIPHN